MTTHTLSLGPLSLLATQSGPLLNVTIHAPSDSAPVGKMTLTVPEWTALVALVDSLVVADKRHAEDRAEVERLTAEHVRDALMVAALRARLAKAETQVQPDIFQLGNESAALRTEIAAIKIDRDEWRVQHDAAVECWREEVGRITAEIDSLRQQVRELTEENESLTETAKRRLQDMELLASDLSAALVSVDAMAERIEQMRPVYEAAVNYCEGDGTINDIFEAVEAVVCKLMFGDTAHTAREQAKEEK